MKITEAKVNHPCEDLFPTYHLLKLHEAARATRTPKLAPYQE